MSLLVRLLSASRAQNGSTTGRLQERAEYTDGPTPRQALIELSFLRFFTGLQESEERTGLRESRKEVGYQKNGGKTPIFTIKYRFYITYLATNLCIRRFLTLCDRRKRNLGYLAFLKF